MSLSETIINSMSKYKSIFEILSNIIIDNDQWIIFIHTLNKLFRKDTFKNLIGDKNYYPQITNNCRFYIKPNNGSCGKGIKIVNNIDDIKEDENFTICPEILTPLIENKYKYDFRVWIAIKSNFEYYICPTFIMRVSYLEFNLNKEEGSLTNTALYSDQFDYVNKELYDKINLIVKDILSELSKNSNKNENNKVMLTGWDFIEDINKNVFVLEVNPNPSVSFLHKKVMSEFLDYLKIL